MYSGDFDVLERTPSIGSHSSVNSFTSFRSSSSNRKGPKSTASRGDRGRTGGGGGMDGPMSREGGRASTGEIIDLDEDADVDNTNMNATGHLFDLLQRSVIAYGPLACCLFMSFVATQSQ